MKQRLALFCALALLCSLLTACSPAAPAANHGAGGITDNPTEPSSQSSEQTDTASLQPDEPKADTAYFVLDGILVGSWEPTGWRSLNDPGGSYEAPQSNLFCFKDVLASPRYTLYSKEGETGYSDFALVNGGMGVSGFEDGDKTALFAPYANPDAGNRWPNSMEIPLPAAFGSELSNLTIPTYGYSLRFSYDSAALATNSTVDLNNFGTVFWSTGVVAQESDTEAMRELLLAHGISSEPHFDEVAMLDLDSDGEQEAVLFANTARDEGGYLALAPEDGGSYSVVLLRETDGSYTPIFEQYLPYTDDVTAHFTLRPIGIFDLNGDGQYEICYAMHYWESGYTAVLSKTQAGWAPVLRANWGM